MSAMSDPTETTGRRAWPMNEDCVTGMDIPDSKWTAEDAAFWTYYDDDPRDRDEEDGDDYDCGLMPDGQCLKAGSEECDWDCPNRNSDLFAGSKAWCLKHGLEYGGERNREEADAE